MRILVTGGAGYVGSRLVPALLEDGHDVVVYDTFWFGDHLPVSGPLTKVRGDIRDAGKFRDYATGCDAVTHLACLSNDPSAEIDAALTKAINLDAFEPLVVAAKEAGVRRFINCSTSSVYGVSSAPDVTEDHPHVPLTLYNTYKSQCEPLLMRHATPDFECVTVRPATICGYSPRQRLDLVVNLLTSQAYVAGRITVLGGDQTRPNLHIEDMVDCYRALLAARGELVQGQTFNVGAGNISVSGLATVVQAQVQRHLGRLVTIERRDSTDPRSYRINSAKIARVLGFNPRRTTGMAVRDLCVAFDDGRVPLPLNRDEYVNVRWMHHVQEQLSRSE